MATLEGWTGTITIAVLFVLLFGVVVASMNNLYNKDYTIAGLETDGYQSAFESYQENVESKLKGGEASFTSAVGLTVSTSWDVIVSTFNLLGNFISGGWIRTIIIDYLHVQGNGGVILAFFLRGLFLLSIGYAILKVLFKVKS